MLTMDTASFATALLLIVLTISVLSFLIKMFGALLELVKKLLQGCVTAFVILAIVLLVLSWLLRATV